MAVVLVVVLAVAGCVLVPFGVSLASVPAAVVVLGCECIAAAYVVAYLRARNAL